MIHPGMRIAAPIVALMLGMAYAAAALPDDPAVPVRQVVLDIMSFTRWPFVGAELRLCVIGRPEYAGAFFQGELRAGGIPVAPQRMAYSDDRLGSGCDAVYEGPLNEAERSTVQLALSGHPVLTVGEAGPGCGPTTMFCLQVAGMQVSFSTNLDAVARSGVRLNPRVLLLGRRPTVPR